MPCRYSSVGACGSGCGSHHSARSLLAAAAAATGTVQRSSPGRCTAARRPGAPASAAAPAGAAGRRARRSRPAMPPRQHASTGGPATAPCARWASPGRNNREHEAMLHPARAGRFFWPASPPAWWPHGPRRTTAAPASSAPATGGWPCRPTRCTSRPATSTSRCYAVALEWQRHDDWLWGGSYFTNSFGQPSGYLYLGQRIEAARAARRSSSRNGRRA